MDLGKEFPDICDTWNDTSFDAVETASAKHGLTAVDLINHLMSSSEGCSAHTRVARSLDSPEISLKGFSKHLFSGFKTVAFINQDYIHTGLDCLDRNLGGGINPCQVTEIFGASGTGKSQFLLWLAAQATITSGSNRKQECSIFISTEASMESRRLSDFLSSDEKALEKISYIYCQDIENLDHILFTQLKVKLEEETQSGKRIKMIFIDSIGHHLRSEDAFINTSVYLRDHLTRQEDRLASISGFNQVKTRLDEQSKAYFKSDCAFKSRISKKHYLLHLYTHLSTLARKYSVAILISNQVSDVFSSNDAENPDFHPFPQDPLEFANQVGVFSGWNLASAIPDSVFSEQCIKKRRAEKLYKENGESKTPTGMCGMISMPDRKTPALGYTWSKLIMQRILLWKVYEPDTEIEQETPFKLELNAVKRPHPDGKSQKQNLRRFARVVSSKALGSSNAVEFEIGDSKIRECIT